MPDLIKVWSGYCKDIKITLPPCLNQSATIILPIKGLPEPPGPVMTVELGTGKPSGRICSNQGKFIFSLCIKALVFSSKYLKTV